MHPTIARLVEVANRHDAVEMAGLFHPDYHSEQPAHPALEFGGAAQVQANWTRMFTGVPDVRLDCVADAVDGSTVWTEWRWSGTYTDGSPFGMNGVVIFGIADDGRIDSARLYMEEVEQGGADIDETVGRLSHQSG